VSVVEREDLDEAETALAQVDELIRDLGLSDTPGQPDSANR